MNKIELIKKRNKLQKELVPIYKAINKIEDEKAKKRWKKLVGKCFKFRNGYSGDETWWLYEKIIGFNETGLITLMVQKDNNGRIDINTRNCCGDYHSGDKRITKEQFDKEYEKSIKELNELRE